MAPLRALLRAGVARGELPGDLDEDAALAALEGPLFHRDLVRADSVPPAALPDLVEAVLTAIAAGHHRRLGG